MGVPYLLALLTAAAQQFRPCAAVPPHPLRQLDASKHVIARRGDAGRKLLQSDSKHLKIDFYYEGDDTRSADQADYIERLMPAAASFLSRSVRVRILCQSSACLPHCNFACAHAATMSQPERARSRTSAVAGFTAAYNHTRLTVRVAPSCHFVCLFIVLSSMLHSTVTAQLPATACASCPLPCTVVTHPAHAGPKPRGRHQLCGPA
jgi:hypothetical protein